MQSWFRLQPTSVQLYRMQTQLSNEQWTQKTFGFGSIVFKLNKDLLFPFSFNKIIHLPDMYAMSTCRSNTIIQQVSFRLVTINATLMCSVLFRESHLLSLILRTTVFTWENAPCLQSPQYRFRGKDANELFLDSRVQPGISSAGMVAAHRWFCRWRTECGGLTVYGNTTAEIWHGHGILLCGKIRNLRVALYCDHSKTHLCNKHNVSFSILICHTF